MDTGPLVAYLDRRDPEHDTVTAMLAGHVGRMFSTGAVMTEAMYFLAKAPSGPAALADFVARSGVVVVETFQPWDLRTAASLMDRYRDVRMDFADATLVMIADVLEVTDVLTLDRRGFSAFRTSDGRPFRLVLDAA